MAPVLRPIYFMYLKQGNERIAFHVQQTDATYDTTISYEHQAVSSPRSQYFRSIPASRHPESHGDNHTASCYHSMFEDKAIAITPESVARNARTFLWIDEKDTKAVIPIEITSQLNWISLSNIDLCVALEQLKKFGSLKAIANSLSYFKGKNVRLCIQENTNSFDGKPSKGPILLDPEFLAKLKRLLYITNNIGSTSMETRRTNVDAYLMLNLGTPPLYQFSIKIADIYNAWGRFQERPKDRVFSWHLDAIKHSGWLKITSKGVEVGLGTPPILDDSKIVQASKRGYRSARGPRTFNNKNKKGATKKANGNKQPTHRADVTANQTSESVTNAKGDEMEFEMIEKPRLCDGGESDIEWEVVNLRRKISLEVIGSRGGL